MKKIAIAIVAVIALLANVNLSAQNVDDQIAQIKQQPADTIFATYVSITRNAVDKDSTVKSDLKTRTITVTTVKKQEIADSITGDTIKQMYLKGLKGAEHGKLFKAMFERGNFKMILIFTGTNRTVSTTISASDF